MCLYYLASQITSECHTPITFDQLGAIFLELEERKVRI
jgi:hypothetical protein